MQESPSKKYNLFDLFYFIKEGQKMPYNYFTNANQYMPTGYNPYYTNQIQRPQDNYQQLQYNRPAGLQGKIVDSIEVVRAIDIPLDGSTSYYPLADGSAIVSKQLQQDGTSKIAIYKPVTGEEKQDENKYITESDLKSQFDEFSSKDLKDIKEEIKNLKKQIRNIAEDIEEKRGE